MSAAEKQVLGWAVTKSQPWHIDRMAPNVRIDDRVELWMGWRSRVRESLQHGLDRSSHCWTALINFEPICMFGIVPESLLGSTGVVWLIGTDAIIANQVGFIRRCRPHLAKMRGMYSYMHNYVSADNTVAIRWLKWLGFHIGPAEPFGPDRAPFHHFEVRNV